MILRLSSNNKQHKPYAIGVVTYINRFESYFKPLVRQLDKVFPGYEKNYVLNGFYDQHRQRQYLQDAIAFLKTSEASTITYYEQHQSLAKCWNQNILRSHNEKILVMNDDVKVSGLFKLCVNLQQPWFDSTVINRSWSHFLISKHVVADVGWFEERLWGVGQEDSDYALRMALKAGVKVFPKHYLHNIFCFGIKNIVAKNTDPGWKQKSATIGNKYSQYNVDFFAKKWEKSVDSKPGYLYAFNEAYYGIRQGMETPVFYPLEALKQPDSDQWDVLTPPPDSAIL